MYLYSSKSVNIFFHGLSFFLFKPLPPFLFLFVLVLVIIMSNSPNSPDDHRHHLTTKKKRVGKACDSCRIKKTKCDGKKPCNRCLSDNKICVFTEKRKPKEKNHPSGYVELLEARLDLLTKSLEKLIVLSRNNLPFINQLIIDYNLNNNNSQHLSESDDDTQSVKTTKNYDEVIPINEIVSYLINEQGLLRNLPVEWEKGALIAANLSNNDNEKQIEIASKKFSQFKQLNIKREDSDLIDTWSPPNSLTENLNIQEFSLGGLNNKSDEIQNLSSPGSSQNLMESFPKKANSLFLSNNDTSSSINSLTNKFENHEIHSPTNLTPTNSQQFQLKRSSSVTSGHNPFMPPRSSSPSSANRKNSYHVHKPQRSNSHNHLHSNQVNNINQNNEFNFLTSKSLSTASSNSLPHTPGNQQNPPVNGEFFNNGNYYDDLTLFNSLPSDAFKTNQFNLQGLDIIDPDNVDNFMINNPF